MTQLDTILLGITLLALSLAGTGSLAYRTRSQSPYWYWGWAVLLISGASSEAMSVYPDLAFVPPLLSPVFSAFMVAGAFVYARRLAPPQLIVAGLALGMVRAVLEAFELMTVSGVVSLLFEPTAAAYAGWIVHRAATDEEASWPQRLMPLGFAAVAVTELLGAARTTAGLERLVLWPFWLASAVPLIGLQLMSILERADRAEGQSAEDQRTREETSERFRILTSRMHEIIAEIGADGRILWVSDSTREELGYAPERLVGMNPAEVAELLKMTREGDNLSAGEREYAPGGLESGVHSLEDAWGKRRHLETRLAPNPTGSVLAISRDVTDRVVSERELQASEERMRKFSLLGSDYCYVSAGALDGHIENWVMGDLEGISGYSHEELQQIGFEGFLHPDEIEESRRRVMELMGSGGESSHEFRLLTKSGETRFIAEKILIERDGQEFRVYGAARDVTEQRRLEQAMAGAQKLESLGLLAGGVAHDFNNLLMVIMGSAEVAVEAARSGEDVSEDLEGIVEAVEQASTLTQQLLAYAGRAAVHKIPVDLTERVQSVSELLSSAGANGVDLQLDLAQSLPTVVADPGEIQQLTMNLVLNAIEACDRDGRVLVSTRSARPEDRDIGSWSIGEPVASLDYVVLEVSDTGSGMLVETQDRAFDPFFTTKATGRGLGLAAVSGSVRSASGALRVTSRVGKGTTFTVLLPASKAEAVARSTSSGRTTSGGRVLIIDDDERVRRVAKRMLEGRGFRVDVASGGRDGVEAYQADEYDVVVLDAVMPGMSGAETFDAIREIDPGAIVLMASGFDMERAVGDLLERGLAGFIGKPFRANSLVEQIDQLIAETSSGRP